jgi:hypothetical protein
MLRMLCRNMLRMLDLPAMQHRMTSDPDVSSELHLLFLSSPYHSTPFMPKMQFGEDVR